MLKDTIAAAQRNDEESLLALIEKFKPLLKKYAYKLHYEDSFYDLQLDFIQIVKLRSTNKRERRRTRELYLQFSTARILQTIEVHIGSVCIHYGN